MFQLDPRVIQVGIALTITGWFLLWTWEHLATRPARRRTRHHPAR